MSKTLFDVYGLASSFSRAEYLSSHNAYCRLHFLIALDEPVQAIADYAAKNLAQLHGWASEYMLTPLHLAVMKGRVEVVEALLKLNAPTEVKDIQEWTPLHHCALLVNRAAIEALLKGRGASPQLKTNLKMTFDDLCAIQSAMAKTRSLENLFLQNSEGSLVQVADAQKELGFTYSDQSVFSFEGLGALWGAKEESDTLPRVHELIGQLALKLEQTPSQLYIKEELVRLESGLSRGLYAKGKISAGEGVGPFSGRVIGFGDFSDFQQRVRERALHGQQVFLCGKAGVMVYDGIGNALYFANDGFPNCGVDFTTSIHCWMIAAEDILEGEPIVFDYGTIRSDLKWGYYRLLRVVEMEAFFSQYPLEEIWRILKETSKELAHTPLSSRDLFKKKYVRSLFFGTKLRYIFQTPAALIHLWCKNLLKIKACYKVLGDVEVQSQLLLFKGNQQHYWWIGKVLWYLEELAKRLSPALRQEVQSFLLDQMQVLSMTQIVKALACIKYQFDAGIELAAILDEVKKRGSVQMKKWGVIQSEIDYLIQGKSRTKEGIRQTFSDVEWEPASLTTEEDSKKWTELMSLNERVKASIHLEKTWPALRNELKEKLPEYDWYTDRRPVLCTLEKTGGEMIIREGEEDVVRLLQRLGLLSDR